MRMRKSSICKVFAILEDRLAMKAEGQTVSMERTRCDRRTESEIGRSHESWQRDYQPRLKWEYCHGLELQAMLDV